MSSSTSRKLSGEPLIQPHAVRDDLRRIPVTLVRHLAHDDPPPAYRLLMIRFGRAAHQLDDSAVRNAAQRAEPRWRWVVSTHRYVAHGAVLGTAHVTGEDQLYSAVRFRLDHRYWLGYLVEREPGADDDSSC